MTEEPYATWNAQAEADFAEGLNVCCRCPHWGCAPWRDPELDGDVDGWCALRERWELSCSRCKDWGKAEI